MIGKIESFEAELQGVPFPYHRVLDGGKVPVLQPRCAENVPAHIAQAHCQFRARKAKCANVPELVDSNIVWERGNTGGVSNVGDLTATVRVTDSTETDGSSVRKGQDTPDLPS